MTASTLPLVATRFGGDGPYWAAWSPIHSGDTDCIVWLSEPQLPNPAYYRWATDAEVKREHVTLDANLVGELLFASGIDPDTLDDAAVAAAVDKVLRRVHCDMQECAAEVYAVMAERWEAAGALFDRCVIRAALALGVAL